MKVMEGIAEATERIAGATGGLTKATEKIAEATN